MIEKYGWGAIFFFVLWAGMYLISNIDLLGILSPIPLFLGFILYFQHKEERRKWNTCNHFWELADKWQDGDKTYWEFYCHNCMQIDVVKK